MKRFVLTTNRTTAEQDVAFLTALKAAWPFVGWWHQLSETWLIVDLQDNLSVTALRDTAKESFAGVHLIVIEVTSASTWAGFSQLADFDWLHKQWDRSR